MNQVGSGSNSGATDWVKAHAELTALARRRAAQDWEEGGLLLQALRTEAHRHLGFGTFGEYVERLFGYSPRTTEEKVRVARELENLPDTDRALRDGALSWSAARELTRVSTPATEKEWLSSARGKTVRQLERLVSGRKPGDLPTDPARPEAKRLVLRFEVSAETAATFREAVAQLRRRSDAKLDDDALLLTLAREVLQGPTDEGRSRYQVLVTTCEHCGQGFQQAAGELVPIEPELVEMACCDAQVLRVTSRADVDIDSHAENGAHAENAQLHVDTDTRAHGGRASQTIPPAIRRRVMRRDHGGCVVPGCRNSTFVDLHHLSTRAGGGGHDEDNLVVLCGAHHRAQHRGQLVIAGSVATGLVFRHADGSVYGDVLGDTAAVCDRAERAFRGLRGLGFSEKESRQALDRVIRENHDRRELSTEALIRSALDLLV